MFERIKFPLAWATLRFWNLHRPSEQQWIDADCEDEARSAPIEEGGLGMPSAFGDDGLDYDGKLQPGIGRSS